MLMCINVMYVMCVRNSANRTVFYHFVGAVPLSTSLFDMLQRLLKDLCDVSRSKNLINLTKYFHFHAFAKYCNYFIWILIHLKHLVMVALWYRADHILSFVLSFFFFFSRIISAVRDWMSAILPHMVWP